MYFVAFRETFRSPAMALALTGVFVIVCQLKINVTNAYAGSIAWSNFFSRLTKSHPGRVVWLVFNVLLALMLMEIGVFRAIDDILRIYANFAAGWIGALTADLVINKPAGLSPPYIEFRPRPPVRRQSGGRGCAAAVDCGLESCLPGGIRHLGAGAVAIRRARDRVPGRPLIAWRPAGATTWRARPMRCRQHRGAALQHLRERVRERGHGDVPGLFRANLFTVLHTRVALP